MVRAAYKQQDNEPIMVDDDSDVEVQVTSGKHRIKREAGASPPRQRPPPEQVTISRKVPYGLRDSFAKFRVNP
jgi:hypothetical protein